MIKTQHPSNNKVLGAPKGWDQNVISCNALPVTVIDGGVAFVSFWRPTAEELSTLNSGGTVALWIFGTVHPPVAVEVEKPI